MTETHAPPSIVSEMLAGPNILLQVLDGAFGEFHRVYRNLKNTLPPSVDLSLPSVIVIGSMNAGKSSLLENITKCEIFPRDTSRCTKMPIKLRLRQVDRRDECKYTVTYKGEDHPAKSSQEILPLVKRIMESTEGLAHDEIVVEFTQV